jgi:hypothetical protein
VLTVVVNKHSLRSVGKINDILQAYIVDLMMDMHTILSEPIHAKSHITTQSPMDVTILLKSKRFLYVGLRLVHIILSRD